MSSQTKPDPNTSLTERSNASGGTTASTPPTGFSAQWTRFINGIEQNITVLLRVITGHAARNPQTYVLGTILLSVGLLATGIFTNFNVDVNDDTLWTPAGSKPVVHMTWIDENMPPTPRNFLLLIHTNGETNAVTLEGATRAFEALDVVRNTPQYYEVCQASTHREIGSNVTTCDIDGIPSFWNDSTALFEASVTSDEELLEALSAPKYPDGRPVDLEGIVGFPVVDDNGLLVSGQSFVIVIGLPETTDAEDFETNAIDRILDLQDAWDADADNLYYHVELMTERSFDDEFGRAIVNDIPLVPLVFTVMSIFTCAIFAKWDKVQSRALLGLGAVMTVLFAIMTGYGLLFIIGVPFTSMTQILPFIMFGIGLDDAFIITGEYNRTSKKKDPVERIDETIEKVGLSVSLTTITSVLAFGLGAISSIPAVYWLCYYAFPTLFINYVFQLTFFVALIVIDEHRIMDNRRDCCVCLVVEKDVSEESTEEETTSNRDATDDAELPLSDRVMLKYADFLLKPWVKAAVIFIFTAMLGGFAYSASLLEQEFKFTDVLPGDSYITDFFDAFDVLYSRGSLLPHVYFRDVDQSDPEIQAQMETYLNELVGIDAIEEQPNFFWLRDFKSFVATHNDTTVADKAFNDQLDLFLEDPTYQQLYREDIIRDESGSILVSRCTSVFMSNVDIDDVRNQIGVLEDQRDVTKAQPINKGQSDWPFFNYADIYNIWEFYSVAVSELVFTTIMGVFAVTATSLILIPHWTASVFVLPLISILYIDLLGFMQMAGAHVNAVSYISLVMSIGLLVDFVVHVLLRYYECEGNRNEKVRETLRTMGSSILIGAISTFLGIIPLGFSSSEIFSTIFNAFIGLVILGSLHGLVLLPVVLSLIGPEECIRSRGLSSPETNDVITPESDAKSSKAMPAKKDFEMPQELATEIDC